MNLTSIDEVQRIYVDISAVCVGGPYQEEAETVPVLHWTQILFR